MQLPLFIPLRRASHHLGVPVEWLKREAEAGRVPHLRVSGRLMFNLDLVRKALTERAAATADDSRSGQPSKREGAA